MDIYTSSKGHLFLDHLNPSQKEWKDNGRGSGTTNDNFDSGTRGPTGVTGYYIRGTEDFDEQLDVRTTDSRVTGVDTT